MTSHRPTLLRRALLGFGAVVVGAVGALSVLAFSEGSAAVEILADDTRHEVRLSHGTVADALGMAGVVLAPEDLVTPDPDTEVAGPMRVFVTRAITVEVVIDEQAPLTVTAPVSSVGGVLAASGLAVSGQALRDEGAVVSPEWRAPVEDGDTITVRRPAEVVVEVDGNEFTVVSLASRVEDLLQLHDVELGPDDLVSPPPTAAVGDDSIVVQRIRFEEEVEEVVLPHGEVRRETADLERGTTEVAQEGRDGLRLDRYRIRFADGDQTGREVLSRDVVTEPEERVVLVGTAEPAPEPPPPSPSTSTSSPTSPSSSTSTSSSSAAASSGVPALDDPVWDRLAQCESNGNWQMNSGNGFYGGLQFMLETWRGVGGQGYPHEASRQEQIRRARLLLEPDAWWATFSHQFPHCSRLLGLN